MSRLLLQQRSINLYSSPVPINSSNVINISDVLGATVTDALNTIKNNIVSLQTDVINLQNDINNLQTDVINLQTDIVNIQSNLDALTLTVNNLQTDINNLTVTVNDIQLDVTALTTDVNNLQADVTALQTDVAALTLIVNTKISDAPIDGKAYVRQDGQWVELSEVVPMSTYSGYGELITVEPSPIIQIDGAEGFTSDQEIISSGTGSATVSNSVMIASTGVGLGSFCVVRSNDIAVYRPGQSLTAKFTSKWSTPVSLGFLMAGLFGSVSAVAVGYSGTTFGMLRRIPGVRGIYKLTILIGATIGETITITLNNVPYVIGPTTGVLTTQQLAQFIATSSVWNGTSWRPTGSENVSPTANESTVTFLQNVPSTAGGAYLFASTGTATGTFATIAAGSPNDDVTDFIPQTSWNGDKLDGFGSSEFLLDPTKLNVWRIVLPYLGAGPIQLFIENVDNTWILCNTIRYPNNHSVPSQGIPSYKLTWAAASLGSTTNISVGGASGEVQVDGKIYPRHTSWARSFNGYTANTIESVPIAFRVRSEFGGVTCGREIRPTQMLAFSGTANRSLVMRMYINPTLTGSVIWSYNNQSNSALEYTKPSSGTVTITGTPVASIPFGSSSAQLNLADLDIRAQPGDIIALSLQTDSSTAVVSGSCNGLE